MNSEKPAESASAEQKKKSSYVLDRPEPYDPQEAIRAVELPHHSTLFRIGVWMTVIGYFILILGAKPSFFGLDRSPVIGFVQTAVIILGLGLMCGGGYYCNRSFFRRYPESLTSGFGIRFVWTGFVISLFTGMADVFGIGSHPLPGVPFFGPLQSDGVVFGECVTAIGLVMLFAPSIERLFKRVRRSRPTEDGEISEAERSKDLKS